jgi:sex comb on midleg-like protein 4
MPALCVPYILAKVATAEECLANAVGMNRYAMDFSHRGSVTHSSSLYKRLTCGDSHLAGGPATTTSGSRTNPVPSGGSSSPGLRLPASSPKRNGTAIEGNRCGNAMHTLETLHRGEVRVILNMTPLGN